MSLPNAYFTSRVDQQSDVLQTQYMRNVAIRELQQNIR